MFKYVLLSLILISNLYSQTEPDIIFEKTFNVKKEYSSIINTTSNLISKQDDYYITYNFRGPFNQDYSGVIKMSDNFEINTQIEFFNPDCKIQNIYIHNDREYIMSRVSKEDPEHPNYFNFDYPKLNIINKDTVENDIYGDIEEQKYRSYIVDIKDDFIYIFAEKIEINGTDTLKYLFIDKYDFNLNLLESNEVDTTGYAINNPYFPDAFYVLSDGSFIVSQRGPFIDFNLTYKHGALTNIDSQGKVIRSDLIFKEEIAWYNEFYLLTDDSFIATGFHRSSNSEVYLTLTKYNKDLEIIWEKNANPSFGNLYQYHKQLIPINEGEYYGSYGRKMINPLKNESINLMKLYNSDAEEIQYYEWGDMENSFSVLKIMYDKIDQNLIILSSNANNNIKIYKLGNFTSVNDNIEKDRILISPNPVNDYLNINKGLQPLVGNIEIYNILGEKMITLIPTFSQREKELRIDVSRLTTGMYFIKIGNQMQKFVKE